MPLMKFSGLAGLLLCVMLKPASGGDDASGPIHYSVDLSQTFTRYAMTEKDKEWGHSLVERLGYHGPVVYFLRTSLPLRVNNNAMDGEVYQASEMPDIFYVVKSDTMLELNQQRPYNPGVLGFSMHAPKSRHFIVALNFFRSGVPLLSGSPVQKDLVTWKGHIVDRLK